MNKKIAIVENGIHMTFLIAGETVRLINFSDTDKFEEGMNEVLQQNGYLAEYQETGMGSSDHRGRKHIGCNPGCWMKYKNFKDTRTEFGRKLEIIQEYNGVELVSHYQFFDGIKVIRSWTEVINNSEQTREIEYVSSFMYSFASYGGMTGWEKKMRLYQASNSWYDECRWFSNTLPELGLNPINLAQSTKRIYLQNEGSWSTEEHLPMGCLRNEETGTEYLWEIEHNGSWYWEVAESLGTMFTQENHNLMITSTGDQIGEIYFQMSGPTEWESQWKI